MNKISTAIARLFELQGRFGREAAREKIELVRAVADCPIEHPKGLVQWHSILCFLRAFPDDVDIDFEVNVAIDKLIDRVECLADRDREGLFDTGIVGTDVHFEFSYPVAKWLAHRFPNQVFINWDDYELPESLDQLLVHFIVRAEQQTFDDGEISTEDWIRQAKGDRWNSDLAWLVEQVEQDRVLHSVGPNLYEHAEVPLRWNLSRSLGSTTLNRAPVRSVYYRNRVEKASGAKSSDIIKPLQALRRLSPKVAEKTIDACIAALATRHREVHAISYANREEVYVADVGKGVQVVVIGVELAHRLSLEGNYGYVIFSNGVPIGYGGGSPLFDQVNTGINIFAEYRGCESAFLFVQVLRTLRALFGCGRFVVNSYQFGESNAEAIASGAFWFYYKLGFRPVDANLQKLALQEVGKKRKSPKHRSDGKTLRALAKSDLHLTLDSSRPSRFFDESWLGIIAAGVTCLITDSDEQTRLRSIKKIATAMAKTLGVRGRGSWPTAQQRSFADFAPIVALSGNLDEWNKSDKASLVRLMRAKGKRQEKEYAQLLQQHETLRSALADYCSKSISEMS